MSRFVIVALLGLGACARRDTVSVAMDEKTYCAQRPSECVLRALEVRL